MKNIEGAESIILKAKCENSLLFFCRYIYRENFNRKFEIFQHLEMIANKLEKVHKGEIKRLIINIPPRFGKTEVAVKMFIAWSLAKNPYSKFIHLSYSDELALDNSSQTKAYVNSEAFQSLWSMELKNDAKGKGKWFNNFGGGVYATGSGGAITGFGAGIPNATEFSGAIIIDDPLKADDLHSDIKRNAINERFNNTIASRVNDRNTPIIVIMQRLHENDLTGYLLNGGSGEHWEHLCLPAINEDGTALYPEKMNLEELKRIEMSNRFVFSGQYMQNPAPAEGGEWRKDWFEIINEKELEPKNEYYLFIDGAYTNDTKNDPTGLQVACKQGNDMIILSSIDKYLELPELIKFIPTYISSLNVKISIIFVEPKASGKSIVQLIRSQTNLNATEIKSKLVNVSKIERARSVTPFLEGGRVKLVNGNWNQLYLQQVAMFPNAKHDEHIDLTSYAIDYLIASKNETNFYF